MIKSLVRFLRFIGKLISLFRVFVLNALFLLLLFILALPFFIDREVMVQDQSALILSLDGDIVEEKQEIDPLSEALNDSFGIESLPQELLLQDILDAIHSAREDDRIVSIVLDLQGLGRVGLNQLHTIGVALESFQLSGKKVIAAEDYYTQNGYYLASFADSIFLNPMGAVDLHGFGVYRTYFKEALEKLRINYHVFRVGAYKSAVEPILRNSMSDEDKQQNRQWLSALWQTFTHNITQRRNLPSNAIDLYANNIPSELALTGGDTAILALNSGLVDDLKTREDLESYFISLTAPDSANGFRHISLKKYLKTIERSYMVNNESKDKIGIIVAQGTILHGKRPPGSIGSESIAELIQSAKNDDAIKGLVLRIDSGGGSVFASEVIRQELLSLKRTGKPYVVSMGNIAASGGYWIAADADEIWASPTTLTGSIGIFGAIPTFENTLQNMGIIRDGIGTTALASGLDLSQPLPPMLKEAIQLTLDHGYEQFLTIVENGRKIDRKKLDSVAEGKVFSGVFAKNIGLVDELGNLDDAVNGAANLAGLESFTAEYLRLTPTFKTKIIQHFTDAVAKTIGSNKDIAILINKTIQIIAPIRDALLFNDPKGLYAHCMITYL